MSSVSWGRRNRYRFAACGQLAHVSAPVLPGVYAITYKQDARRRPKAHTVLLFGQAADASKQIQPMSENIRRWWHEHSSEASELFVFLHPMPGSSEIDRARVQSELVAEYDPQGNA
jgi:hypothetical protein